jgi:hypothetical protein
MPTVVVAAVAVLMLLGWWAVRESAVDRSTHAIAVEAPLAAPPPAPAADHAAPRENDDDAPLSAFGAPGGTMARDLELLHEALVTWQTNFPAAGNPVGDNAEIVRALTGDNPLGLVLLPAGHPAIGPDGTLRDRWGTPLFFHQLSGHAMELRSAGPDRRFYTDDDIVWSPGPADEFPATDTGAAWAGLGP